MEDYGQPSHSLPGTLGRDVQLPRPVELLKNTNPGLENFMLQWNAHSVPFRKIIGNVDSVNKSRDQLKAKSCPTHHQSGQDPQPTWFSAVRPITSITIKASTCLLRLLVEVAITFCRLVASSTMSDFFRCWIILVTVKAAFVCLEAMTWPLKAPTRRRSRGHELRLRTRTQLFK